MDKLFNCSCARSITERLKTEENKDEVDLDPWRLQHRKKLRKWKRKLER